MGTLFSCFVKNHKHAEPEPHPNKNPIMYYLQEKDCGLNQTDLVKLSNIYSGIYTALCPSYCPIEDVFKVSKYEHTILATVADGHHGSECAHFTVSILHDVLGYLLQHMPPVKALESSHLILDEFILNLPFYLDLLDFKNHYNLEMQIGSLDTPMRMGTTKTTQSLFHPLLNLDLNAIGIALSGATSLTAMVTLEENKRKLYVANLGDSSAVLVRKHNHHEQEFSAYKLTKSHTAKSMKEYERLIREHPDEEKTLANVNSYGEMRLLGVLIPTRSFGDSILKWQVKESQRINKLLSKQPHVYTTNIKRSTLTEHLETAMKTPPYVTAKPEIYVRDLENNENIVDKYCILGSDGIWDKISPEIASYLTIHAMRKRKNIEINKSNLIRVQSLPNVDMFNTTSARIHPCLLDTNPATAILRYVLGSEDELVTLELNYPYPMSKQKRDDCTVIVIDLASEEYFKSPSMEPVLEDLPIIHDYHKPVIDLAHPINSLSHFEKVHSEQSVLVVEEEQISPIQEIITSSLNGKSISQLNKSTSGDEYHHHSDDLKQDIPSVNISRGEYIVNSLFA